MGREKNLSFTVTKSRYWSRSPPFYEIEVATKQKGGSEKNKLIHGNALTFLKEIQDNSIDLIVTDPPYRISKRGNPENSGGMMKKTLFMQGQVFENNGITPEEYIPDFFRILKNGSHCYIMTNHKNLKHMLDTATEHGFKFVKSLIWDKQNKIMGQYYMSQFEYILFFRKGRGKKINDCGTSDILRIPNHKTKDSTGKNFHDTEKPVELMKILIKNSSQIGELVLDPFGGIGTVAVACQELDRQYTVIEINEKYYETAKMRLQSTKNK